uniref:Peptidylprolyl isomerase n=1 Tax=Physcomitrium patens TaxID=3218 RepID=A0A2K1IR86_PHYPA|nr:hypothetical protein PHYPA_025912 [Physcomitrium patens]
MRRRRFRALRKLSSDWFLPAAVLLASAMFCSDVVTSKSSERALEVKFKDTHEVKANKGACLSF